MVNEKCLSFIDSINDYNNFISPAHDIGISVNSAEEHARFQNFKENYMKVLHHNHQYAQNKVNYRTAINRFAHMSQEEVRKYRSGGFIPLISASNEYLLSNGKDQNENGDFIPPPLLAINQNELPSEINWVSKNVVTPIKDQMNCGSCWAFTSVINIQLILFFFNPFKSFIDYLNQYLLDWRHRDSICDQVRPYTFIFRTKHD
jgi:hypothetical protein